MARLVAIPPAPPPDDLRRPGPHARLFAFGGETMGTTWSARFYAPADHAPGHLLARIDDLFARFTAQMSLWAPQSDICRFNAAPPGSWVALPDPFFAVLADARAVAAQTQGAFDPTLGALADRWGFGAHPPGDMPGPAEAGALARAAGWRRLRLDEAGRRVLQPGGLALDLNAIAKGDAVDRLGALMDAAGLRVWLAEIGGELRGRGCKPDWTPWWAALEPPPGENGKEGGDAPVVIALSGAAVATSGTWRRARRIGGRAVCHTIDPASGAALPDDGRMVSVVARTCRRADALATALFVMGPARGLEHAAAHDIAALFAGPEGRAFSPAFAAMLAD